MNEADATWVLAFVITPLLVVALGWAMVLVEERADRKAERKRSAAE